MIHAKKKPTKRKRSIRQIYPPKPRCQICTRRIVRGRYCYTCGRARGF